MENVGICGKNLTSLRTLSNLYKYVYKYIYIYIQLHNLSDA